MSTEPDDQEIAAENPHAVLRTGQLMAALADEAVRSLRNAIRLIEETRSDAEAADRTIATQAERIAVLEQSSPDDLRAAGWTVAVHNDYRQGDLPHTFWLLTKDGRAVKGEGLSDQMALDDIRTALSAQPQPKQEG